MKIAVAMASHETGTFNPSSTTMSDFAALGIHRGSEMLNELQGIGSIGGFLDAAAARSDVEVAPLLAAQTVPGGRVDTEVISSIGTELVDRLQAALPVDGVALYLHGACAGDGLDDVDGHWLSLVRAVVGPTTPIALGLDHHANVTGAMVDLSDVIVGHRTQPHDLFDTARITAGHLFRLVDGEVSPTTAWRKIPMLTHQEQFLSDEPPMSIWFDRAREIERTYPSMIAISTFPMQPWFDVEEAGWAVVVHTKGDPELADAVADELANLVWALRHDLSVRTSIPVAEAVRRAEAAENGLTVLSDTGDSVIGGSGGDSTAIIAELIAQDGRGPALVTLVEPLIHDLVRDHRVGEALSVTVGGAVSRMHPAVTLHGVVVYKGPLVVGTPNFWAATVDFGYACAIRTSFGVVVVSERRGVGGVIPAQYEAIGLTPSDFKIAVVKSASNFQFYDELSTSVIRVDTPGPTQSDLDSLPWVRIPRPMFPFDRLETWHSEEDSPSEP